MQLTRLDDRTQAELVQEAIGQIPSLAPPWTDYNPSDPGMTLVEMLAWVTETVLYQTDQISPAILWRFLRLLNDPDNLAWKQIEAEAARAEAISPAMLEKATRHTLTYLRTPFRAVTSADYEQLLLQEWPRSPEAKPFIDDYRSNPTPEKDPYVRRVLCVPERNLEASTADAREAVAPAHLSLILLRASQASPSPALRSAWRTFLEPRSLLTTRLHLVGATYVGLAVNVTLVPRPGYEAKQLIPEIQKALASYYHPLTGGPAGAGWPYGRSAYRSEVMALVDQVTGVDYVTNLFFEDRPGGDPVGQDKVELQPGQFFGSVTVTDGTAS